MWLCFEDQGALTPVASLTEEASAKVPPGSLCTVRGLTIRALTSSPRTFPRDGPVLAPSVDSVVERESRLKELIGPSEEALGVPHRSMPLRAGAVRRATKMVTLHPSARPASVAVALAIFAVFAAPSPGTHAAQSNDSTAAKPSGPLPQVTVTARKEIERRRLDQVLIPRFIRAHGVLATKTDQLARWRSGLCPDTVGLPAAFNSFVSRRIREVAVSVGAPVEVSAKCKPNVQIFFATQPQKQLDEVVHHAPEMLGAYYRPEAKRFETFSRTIQPWYMTATRGAAGEEWVDSVYDPTPGGVPGSRLRSGISSWIVHVLIIADVNKVDGYTIGSVSDYIAMLVLAQPASLDTCDELPSITDLMASHCDQGQKAEALTVGDVAYLKGLYSADLELTSSLERSHIHNRMMQELGRR